jgi:hypothetical protein
VDTSELAAALAGGLAAGAFIVGLAAPASADPDINGYVNALDAAGRPSMAPIAPGRRLRQEEPDTGAAGGDARVPARGASVSEGWAIIRAASPMYLRLILPCCPIRSGGPPGHP